jgi:mono/diheme cytochrome c family protein
MEKDHRRSGMGIGIVILALGLLALLAAIGLLVVYTGAYNIAATEQHTALTRWAFGTTMQRSVQQRAASVPAADEATPAMLAKGAGDYRTMCQHCHGGPGVERESWADGMRPRPPHLVEAAAEWQRNEVFWLLKHGVKMFGMPAFGPSHDDQALWAIASFVKQLPAMTPQRYAELTGEAQGGTGAADEPREGATGAGHHASQTNAQSQEPGK